MDSRTGSWDIRHCLGRERSGRASISSHGETDTAKDELRRESSAEIVFGREGHPGDCFENRTLA